MSRAAARTPAPNVRNLATRTAVRSGAGQVHGQFGPGLTLSGRLISVSPLVQRRFPSDTVRGRYVPHLPAHPTRSHERPASGSRRRSPAASSAAGRRQSSKRAFPCRWRSRDANDRDCGGSGDIPGGHPFCSLSPRWVVERLSEQSLSGAQRPEPGGTARPGDDGLLVGAERPSIGAGPALGGQWNRTAQPAVADLPDP
jgi:hypothetical protein